MEQSSRETSSATSQENPHIICNPKVHCHAHNSPPLVPILNQINPFCNLPSYFFKIYINIILPYALRCSMWCLSLQVSPSKPCVRSLDFNKRII
jgi:hypothetical protein